MSNRRQSTPNGYIWTGLVVAAVTGVLSGSAGLDEGRVIALVIGGAISSVLLGIGIVAKGIEVADRAKR